MKNKTDKLLGKKKPSKLTPGFIAALAICLVAIGAASYSTYKSIDDYINPTEVSTDSQESDSTDVNNLVSGIIDSQGSTNLPQIATDSENTVSSDNTQGMTSDTGSSGSTDNSAGETPSTSDLDTANTDTSVITDDSSSSDNLVSDKYLYPVGQTVLKGFSGNTPVYSETMKDWRVHLGTDFFAEKGTQVKPITIGTVKDIYTDGLFGVTVVIDHGNGVVAYYSGLGTTTLVNVGDSVGVGDYIGSVNTVPSESVDDAHLHLEIKVNDEYVDPMSLLADTNQTE